LYGYSRSLCRTINRRFGPFGTEGGDLSFRHSQIGAKCRVGMEPRNRGGAHDTPLDHIAVPVNVADIAALACSGAISAKIKAQAQPMAVWPDG